MAAVIKLKPYVAASGPGHARRRVAGAMQVTLTIDGQQVTVPAGTSVMRAAALAGIDIPKLCASDTLEAFGSCRVCLVEIEGRRGTPASCTTLVEEGMVVHTGSDKLARLRKNVIELYLSDHPEQSDGENQLQALAAQMGIRDTRYGRDGANHQCAAVDDSNPYFSFDPASCIVCYRCVRACEEIQGTFALTVNGRGFDSQVTASASRTASWTPSACPAGPVWMPARPPR